MATQVMNPNKLNADINIQSLLPEAYHVLIASLFPLFISQGGKGINYYYYTQNTTLHVPVKQLPKKTVATRKITVQIQKQP